MYLYVLTAVAMLSVGVAVACFLDLLNIYTVACEFKHPISYLLETDRGGVIAFAISSFIGVISFVAAMIMAVN